MSLTVTHLCFKSIYIVHLKVVNEMILDNCFLCACVVICYVQLQCLWFRCVLWEFDIKSMSSFMFSFYFSHKNRLVFLFIIFVRRFLFICLYLFFTLCFLAQYVLPVVIIYHSRRLILLSDWGAPGTGWYSASLYWRFGGAAGGAELSPLAYRYPICYFAHSSFGCMHYLYFLLSIFVVDGSGVLRRNVDVWLTADYDYVVRR